MKLKILHISRGSIELTDGTNVFIVGCEGYLVRGESQAAFDIFTNNMVKIMHNKELRPSAAEKQALLHFLKEYFREHNTLVAWN
ncbi:hypothetical protein [Desulfovibrio sp.]